MPRVRIKLPIINHWNALCITGDKGLDEITRTRAMEPVKIYLLMALISTIAAVSHRKDRRDSTKQTG
jgi:hypothetical protein